jgi:integrase
MRYWQDLGRPEAWTYSACRSVLDMWRWVSDDPERFHDVPVPPREAKTVLPRLPVYVAPPAPSMAEIDACLRHLSPDAEESRRLGVLMRFTGLRITQSTAIRIEDIDRSSRALTVRVGKSHREEASARMVPLSEHLMAEIERWLVDRKASGPLFPAWGNIKVEKTATTRNPIFHTAWAAATEAGEVRRVVWNPCNRKIARPQQAFRAAFQAFLRSKGVGDEVIDALVGHTGRSVRERHYAGPDSLWDRMAEAVALIPDVDWLGPDRRADGKVVEIGRRG